MAPRDRDRQPDQHEPGRGGEHAGEVAAGRARVGDVLDVHHAVDGRGAPKNSDDGRAAAQDAAAGRRRWRRAAEERDDARRSACWPRSTPGAAVEEGVVERMDERDGDRGAEDERLARAAWARRARWRVGSAWLRSCAAASQRRWRADMGSPGFLGRPRGPRWCGLHVRGGCRREPGAGPGRTSTARRRGGLGVIGRVRVDRFRAIAPQIDSTRAITRPTPPPPSAPFVRARAARSPQTEMARRGTGEVWRIEVVVWP